MSKRIALFIAAFCLVFTKQAAAQTAKFYKDRSDSFYEVANYDSALYDARLAEFLIIDTFSKNSVQYAWFVGQYFSMNYEKKVNIDSASYWYDYSIRLFETLHDTTSGQYGETLINYGNMLTRMGSFTKSFPYLKKGVEVASNYPNELDGYLGSRNNLANYYQYTGDYLKAEILYQEVLEAIGQHPGEVAADKHITVLLNLAEVNNKSGYTQMAEKYFERGLDSLRKNVAVKDKYFEALNNYAMLCIAQNNAQAAKKLLEKALGDPYFESVAAGNVKAGSAAAYALALSCLGNAYLADDKKRAELLYRQSIQVAENMSILPYLKYTTLANLARLYISRRQFVKADSIYKEVVPQLDEHPDRDNYAYTKIYGDYCENLLHLHQTEKAASIILAFTTSLLQVMNNNIGGMPEEKQMRYIASLNRYINLMFSAIAASRTQQLELVSFSLNNLLHLKGLILNMQLQKMISLRSSADSGLYRLNNQLKIIKEALYYEYTQQEKHPSRIDSLQMLAGNYESKISAATGLAYNSGNAAPAAEIQARLGKGHAAVEYVYYTNAVTGRKMYGAFITRYGNSQPLFIELFTEAKLKACLTNANSKIFDPEKQLDHVETIFHLAWRPLAPHLSGADTIYYSPAGLLSYVAFDAMKLQSENYLLSHKYLKLVSSTRSLLNSVNNERIASAVVWGNIDCSANAYVAGNTAKVKPANAGPRLPDDVRKGGNSTAFPPLPPDELPDLIKLVKQQEIDLALYEKDEATEENFKQDAASFNGLLHISTHGYYYGQLKARNENAADSNAFRTHVNPLLRCGLILKGGNHAWRGKNPLAGTEDGILTGYEIAMTDLSKVKLVVLSACETGLGDIDAGSEGILGLQRAFKMAGVQHMVLSLWKVNATFTKELMTRFYTILLNGTNPATALHVAKKQMAKKNPPYTWAGFVLVE